MVTKNSPNALDGITYIELLQKGNQLGLNYFYMKLYVKLYHWSFRRVKDDVAASCITHEAFLTVWLLRTKINTVEKLIDFLEQNINRGCSDFYLTNTTRFHRNLIKLDDIENYQEWLCGFDTEEETDIEGSLQQQNFDNQQLEQWKEVERVLPSLSDTQQKFIKLCLKYSFNCTEIAAHIGGTSEYQAEKDIQSVIKTLKNIISNSKKLNNSIRKNDIRFQDDLTNEQVDILHMRYQLQLSFEEIAKKMNLNQLEVQKSFITVISKAKQLKTPNTKT